MATVTAARTPLAWRGPYLHFVQQYRRLWRGTVVTGVVEPVVFLAAMGVGLGSIVNHRPNPGLHGVPYVAFIGAGITASSAMQVAMFEGTWPVMSAIKWSRIYHAMLAGPATVADVVTGHLAWIATRVASVVALYLALVAAFGGIRSWWAVLAWPAATLGGAAVGAVILAYAGRTERDSGFTALFRFVFLPLFLFSGTFFPITQLPRGLQYVAYATPLWHSVSLVRDLTLGGPRPDDLVHLAYLAVFGLAGVVLARRTFAQRLVR